jgi:DNA-binding NtrC family response regulator
MKDATKFSALVFVIDDDPNLCEWVSCHLTDGSQDVECFPDAATGLQALRQGTPDVVILDMDLPDLAGLDVLLRIRRLRPELPVVMLTVSEEVPVVVKAMSSGAFDYLTKPVSVERLSLVVRNAIEQHRLRRQVLDLRRSNEDAGTLGLVGSSPVMLELHRSIERVAPTNVSVLIHGESGTGKELVARALHDVSERTHQPFVAVNCAAIPEPLQEDEFFGHERGAFTGAQAMRRGCIERANNGTLFLDEVAELSSSLQATLLRVLQEHTLCRIGGTEEIKSDFRVVAATNRDLIAAVSEGEFRLDLYYRLAVFEIELAPLRMRPADIPELAATFLKEIGREAAAETVPGFDAAAMEILLAHSWPGNVRELRNAVHRGFVAAGGGMIRSEHLPPRMLEAMQDESRDVASSSEGVVDSSVSTSGELGSIPVSVLDRDELERVTLLRALHQCNGRVDEAARVLGIGRTTLYRRRKKHGLL